MKKLRDILSEFHISSNLPGTITGTGGHAPAYFKVVNPFELYVKTGMKSTNYHYGNGQIKVPTWELILAKPGDEIHDNGSLYYVEKNKTTALPMALSEPDESFHPKSRYEKFNLKNLERFDVPSKQYVKYSQ